MDAIKVLIVDDSILIRKILSDILSDDPQIEVVGLAPDGKAALQAIDRYQPDVVTLDVEMPEMDGIETLKRIMTDFPRPVVMISAFTDAGAELTLQALDLGAVDFITKPHAVFSGRLMDIHREIVMKVKEASRVRVDRLDADVIAKASTVHLGHRSAGGAKKQVVPGPCGRIISIGISTGGPKALGEIMPRFPADINAAILIVQHLPQPFTKALANRLNTMSKIEVKEAEEADAVHRGKAYIAKGDFHLSVTKERSDYIVHLDQHQKVCLFRPSIDVLMESTASVFRNRNIGVIMTGMGRDGVQGIQRVKREGGVTLAQDKQTSAIYGMNRLAIESGCIDHVLPLEEIVPAVLNLLN